MTGVDNVDNRSRTNDMSRAIVRGVAGFNMIAAAAGVYARDLYLRRSAVAQ